MKKSNVLIIANLTGWMGWHIELFRRGIEKLGYTVTLADYHRMARPLGLKMLSGVQADCAAENKAAEQK